MVNKLTIGMGVLGLCWAALGIHYRTGPAVVLHYSEQAKEPVVFFLMEDSDTIKQAIHPGTSVEFHTTHRPGPDYYLSVSLPLASRDDVEITPPFSRVDVYIGADTKITRTDVKTDFLARFGFDWPRETHDARTE